MDNLKAEATYSLEDNKLRIYPKEDMSPEQFQAIKAEGFLWAPAQRLFYARKWTPEREDFCLRLALFIGIEPRSILDRAKVRAQRARAMVDKHSAALKKCKDKINKDKKRSRKMSPASPMYQKVWERIKNNSDKEDEQYRLRQYWYKVAMNVVATASKKAEPESIRKRILALRKELQVYTRKIGEMRERGDVIIREIHKMYRCAANLRKRILYEESRLPGIDYETKSAVE